MFTREQVNLNRSQYRQDPVFYGESQIVIDNLVGQVRKEVRMTGEQAEFVKQAAYEYHICGALHLAPNPGRLPYFLDGTDAVSTQLPEGSTVSYDAAVTPFVEAVRPWIS